jgi:hypothetical protein
LIVCFCILALQIFTRGENLFFKNEITQQSILVKLELLNYLHYADILFDAENLYFITTQSKTTIRKNNNDWVLQAGKYCYGYDIDDQLKVWYYITWRKNDNDSFFIQSIEMRDKNGIKIIYQN